MTIEGTLESITGVRIMTRRDRTYGMVGITSSLVIAVGERKKEEVDFPGFVFPDSIGHRVKYFRQKDEGRSSCGSPMLVGETHFLLDQEINRVYEAYVSFISVTDGSQIWKPLEIIESKHK